MNTMFDLEVLMELVEKREFRKLKELLLDMNEMDVAAFTERLDSEKNSSDIPNGPERNWQRMCLPVFRWKTAAYH